MVVTTKTVYSICHRPRGRQPGYVRPRSNDEGTFCGRSRLQQNDSFKTITISTTTYARQEMKQLFPLYWYLSSGRRIRRSWQQAFSLRNQHQHNLKYLMIFFFFHFHMAPNAVRQFRKQTNTIWCHVVAHRILNATMHTKAQPRDGKQRACPVYDSAASHEAVIAKLPPGLTDVAPRVPFLPEQTVYVPCLHALGWFPSTAQYAYHKLNVCAAVRLLYLLHYLTSYVGTYKRHLLQLTVLSAA